MTQKKRITKKRNPTDSTLRNVRAANRRIEELEFTVSFLKGVLTDFFAGKATASISAASMGRYFGVLLCALTLTACGVDHATSNILMPSNPATATKIPAPIPTQSAGNVSTQEMRPPWMSMSVINVEGTTLYHFQVTNAPAAGCFVAATHHSATPDLPNTNENPAEWLMDPAHSNHPQCFAAGDSGDVWFAQKLRTGCDAVGTDQNDINFVYGGAAPKGEPSYYNVVGPSGLVHYPPQPADGIVVPLAFEHWVWMDNPSLTDYYGHTNYQLTVTARTTRSDYWLVLEFVRPDGTSVVKKAEPILASCGTSPARTVLWWTTQGPEHEAPGVVFNAYMGHGPDPDHITPDTPKVKVS